jgi:integrase
MTFTDKTIREIVAAFEHDRKKKGVKERIIFDDELKGFGFRLQGDSRTWIVQYRAGLKQRRVKIGPWPAVSPSKAFARAREIIGGKWTGEDEQAKRLDRRAKDKITLRHVVDHYLEWQQPRLRVHSFEEISRYLLGAGKHRYWKPLHDLPIDKIEQPMVASQLRDIIKNNGPVAASRARTGLSSMFTWAMKEGFCSFNPVTATNDPGAGIKPRDRVLNDAELAKVWNACADDDYGRSIRLLILTGQRLREVGEMSWSELDRDSGKWRIPGKRTKNGRDHELTLPGAAWAIIDTVHRRDWNDHLFGRSSRGFTGWSAGKVLLDQRAKLAGPWVVHDLRRSVATGLADLKVEPHVIEALLNHVSGHKRGVAGVYNRSTYALQTRNALAQWADHIASVTQQTERKILSFLHERGSGPAA